MGGKRIAITAVVLIGLAGLLAWQMRAREAEVDVGPDIEVTLPKIDKDTIDELVLAAPEKPKVRHVKKGDEWQLVEPLEARSDPAAIRTALDKLGELEVTGVAATKKENHAALEVDEKTGTHVIARAGGKTVLDVWIGRYNAGSSMVRQEGAETVATVKGSIRFAFSKELKDWRDRSILKLDPDSVRGVELSNAAGTLAFVKGDGGWAQAPGQAPIEKFDPERVKSLITMLATLNAVDFAAKDERPDKMGLEEGAATLVLSTESDAGPGEVLLRIGKANGTNRYLERDGVEQKFLVSKWVADRLTGGPDTFQKSEEPPPGVPKPDNVPMQQIDPHSPDMQRQIQEALRQAQQK